LKILSESSRADERICRGETLTQDNHQQAMGQWRALHPKPLL